MDSGVPSVSPSMVILQPTALCNLNCSYCYLPDRRDRGLMSDEVLDACVSFVFACDFPGNEVELLWHAGEPLVAGLAFYERAFALIAECAPKGLRVRHILQTNGTLLSQAWCDLFSKYQVDTGLSVDGPAEIHDLSRKTRVTTTLLVMDYARKFAALISRNRSNQQRPRPSPAAPRPSMTARQRDGSRTSFPVVRRARRSSCARRACDRAYSPPATARNEPCATRSKSSAIACGTRPGIR